MIDTLVLAGGGLKGFSMIESINQLILNNIIKLKNIKNYYCTSVGTIISLLLALGYSMDELYVFINNFDFNKLSNDIDADNLFNNFGLSNGNSIMTILQSLVYEKIHKYDITFLELYKQKYIKLNVITTNITDGCEEVFNYLHSPNMSILITIRMSIAVPLIFTPVEYNNKKYLDGGLVNNFPINHAKTKNYLGIASNYNSTFNLDYLSEYIFNFVNLAIKTITLKNITKFNKFRLIFLEKNEDINELDFDIKNINKLKMVGLNSTLNFLKKNNFLIKKIRFLNYLNYNLDIIVSSFYL
tara:strand:+ start:1373 stop:2269 length:897 start_codon:yes stop_codon:yes gene_type:complete